MVLYQENIASLYNSDTYNFKFHIYILVSKETQLPYNSYFMGIPDTIRIKGDKI